MSFIRLLALSYLAWAAVFVVTVVLVAHLPLPGGMAAGSGTPDHKTAKIAAQLPPGLPDAHVARLELAPVISIPNSPIPNPPANDALSPPKPPAAQQPEHMPALIPAPARPPVVVVKPPVLPHLPAAKPEPRPVARLELAPAPVPVARPQGGSPKPHVVTGPTRKPSSQPHQGRVAALPEPPQPPEAAGVRGKTNLASAGPAFRIPDPPPSSLANLPDHLQPAGSRKRASVEPAFRIPDPPPLDPPIFNHARFLVPFL